MGLLDQEAAGSRLGKDYPTPIVDHLAAAKLARERIYAVRKGSRFREEAETIQLQHGSRKSRSLRPLRKKLRSNLSSTLQQGNFDF